jgi:hypothetical protein
MARRAVRRRGRLIRARPIASICCSPPDSVPPRCAMRSFRREQREHAVEIFAALGFVRSVRRRRPCCRFSSTVMRGKMRRPSGDCAMRSRAIMMRRQSKVMSRPSNTIVPAARGGDRTPTSSASICPRRWSRSARRSRPPHLEIDAFQRLDIPVGGAQAADAEQERAHMPALHHSAASASSAPR